MWLVCVTHKFPTTRPRNSSGSMRVFFVIIVLDYLIGYDRQRTSNSQTNYSKRQKSPGNLIAGLAQVKLQCLVIHSNCCALIIIIIYAYHYAHKDYSKTLAKWLWTQWTVVTWGAVYCCGKDCALSGRAVGWRGVLSFKPAAPSHDLCDEGSLISFWPAAPSRGLILVLSCIKYLGSSIEFMWQFASVSM